MTPEQEELLKSIDRRTLSMEQLLKGYNGEIGLCARLAKLVKDFYSFRLAVMVSGALLFGTSGFGLAKVLELVR